MTKLLKLFFVLTIIVIVNAAVTKKAKLCTTKDGTEGKCVPLARCINGTIITNGFGMIDPRFDNEVDIRENANECEHYFEECCSLKKIRPGEETGIVTPPVQNSECGMRNEHGVGIRIMGADNNEAEYGEFPWMVAVLQRKYGLLTYLCGGSLIGENVVLTAAHCLNESNLNDITIRVGEYDAQTELELFPHFDYKVEKVVIHENFYRGALLNDIALLFVDQKVIMNDIVKTICLPTQDQSYDNKNCIATGWGKNQFGKEGLYQTILKKVELPTVPFDRCEEMFKETRLGEDYELDESFMCAGGEEGIDTCKGDGGSPLVCPIEGVPDHYYQAGIVAWGIECGLKDVPGAYVNVAKYRTWIDNQIQTHS